MGVQYRWIMHVYTHTHTHTHTMCLYAHTYHCMSTSPLPHAARRNSTGVSPSSTPPDTGLSQPVTIVITVVVTAVLILVVELIVAMVAVIYRRRRKQHIYQDADANRGVKFWETSRLGSTICYERMTADMDHTPGHHQPRPPHAPHTITTSDNGDHISMQDCPPYQAIEEGATSGEYSYI